MPFGIGGPWGSWSGRLPSAGRPARPAAPHFVMIRAVTRLLLFLVIGLCARGETLDDAVRTLAKKVMARLGPTEAPRLTSRNLTSLAASEATKAQATFDRALRRRLRNPMPVDVSFTISENLRGYLLVAELRRDTGTQVDMVEFRPDPPPAQVRPPVALEKKVLWEQPTPILDLIIVADQMFVLEPTRIARYEKNTSKWELKETSALPPINVRDPRGRLEVSGDALFADLPGFACKGAWKPALDIQCQEGGQFLAARNTMDLHDWRAPFFNSVEVGSEVVVAETDGHTRIYDATRNPAGAFDGWGSDLVLMVDACGGSFVAASAPGDRKSVDSIALYFVIERAPVRVSDPTEFPGPVTALWPAGSGAMAVVRNLSTGSYAAYVLSVDCGH
jgi:hypothetical protein